MKEKKSNTLRHVAWLDLHEREIRGEWNLVSSRIVFRILFGIFQGYWLYLIRVDQHRETDGIFVGCRIVWEWTNLLSLAVASDWHRKRTRAWSAISNESVVNTGVDGFNCFYGNSNGNVVDESESEDRIRSSRYIKNNNNRKRNSYCLLKMMLLKLALFLMRSCDYIRQGSSIRKYKCKLKRKNMENRAAFVLVTGTGC